MISTAAKVLLKFHIQVHENKKIFKCTFKNCTGRFNLKQTLWLHTKKHERGKPYIRGRYANKNTLNGHGDPYKVNRITNLNKPIDDKMF